MTPRRSMPQWNLRPHVLVLLFGVPWPWACSNAPSTEVVPSASGQYVLSSYNGSAIPADIGALPPHAGDPGGCRIVVTAGSLSLDVEAARFSYAYEVHNGCTGDVLSRPSVAGALEQNGTALTFRVSRVDGVIEFPGTVQQGVITLRPGGTDVLVFR